MPPMTASERPFNSRDEDDFDDFEDEEDWGDEDDYYDRDDEGEDE